MQVVHNAAQLATFLASGFDFQTGILIDQYLTNAIEVDVDALCDGRQTVIAGVMEHIEEAGIHSGDSSCVMPPHSLDADMIERIKGICKMLAEALQVQGFINIQLAVQDGGIYVLEANPRASRTIPFVSKATGIPWAAIGTRVIMGETLESLEHLYANPVHCVAVKSVVLPFNKFPEAEVKVGPEMRSTGEVMGIGADVHEAYRKAQSAADRHLRAGKSIWLSGSRMRIAEIATLAEKISSSPAFAAASRNRIAKLSAQDPGHTHFLATEPAKLFLSEKLEECLFIPDARFLPTDSVDLIKSLLSTHDVGLVISLGLIDTANELEQKLRRAAINANIPLIMSFSDALMSVNCLFDPHNQSFTPVALQDLAQPATRGEPESAPQHRDTLATFEGSHRQQEV
jgi:hypothetical protein